MTRPMSIVGDGLRQTSILSTEPHLEKRQRFMSYRFPATAAFSVPTFAGSTSKLALVPSQTLNPWAIGRSAVANKQWFETEF